MCPYMLHLIALRLIGLAVFIVGLQPVLDLLLHLRLFLEIFHLCIYGHILGHI